MRYSVKIIETEKIMVVARGKQGSCLMGTVSILQDEKEFWRRIVVMVVQ